MFKYLVLAILGFAVGVGGAFIVAQQGAPGPASAAAPGEPVIITIGPPPDADIVFEVDADFNAGGQTIQVNAEAFGNIRGERVAENVDVYVHLDGVEVRGGGQHLEESLDVTVRYRIDPTGRIIDTSMIGNFGGSLPIPINPAEGDLNYFAPPHPPGGYRIGDRFTVTESQPLNNQFMSGDATMTTTVTVSDLTRYRGRDALAFRFDGTVDGSGVSGSFTGSALVDVASGIVLTGDLDLSADMAAAGADIDMEMSFAMEL